MIALAGRGGEGYSGYSEGSCGEDGLGGKPGRGSCGWGKGSFSGKWRCRGWLLHATGSRITSPRGGVEDSYGRRKQQ